MDEVIKIYTDGGARGNPGPSAGAFVVIDGDRIVHKESIFFGIQTNNVAEYEALIASLNWLNKNKQYSYGKNIVFYLDSELVVKQLNGLYKIKNNNLKTLATRVRKLYKDIGQNIIFKSVPREKNKLADSLLNEKLDEKLV